MVTLLPGTREQCPYVVSGARGSASSSAAVPVRGRWGPGECQQLRSSARTWSVGPGGVPAAPAAVPVRGRWGPGECQQLRQQCPYVVGGARGSASSSAAVPVHGRWGPGECQQLRQQCPYVVGGGPGECQQLRQQCPFVVGGGPGGSASSSGSSARTWSVGPGGVPAAPQQCPYVVGGGPGECQQLRQQCPYVVGGARGSASSSGSSARTWSVGPGGVPAAPAAVPVRGRWGPGECQQLRQQCPYVVGGARGSASSSGSSARTWSVGPGGVPAAPAAVPVHGRWGPGECQQLRQQCPCVVGGARGSASSSGSSARTWSVGPGGVPAAPAAVPVRGRWGPGECQQLRSSARTWSVGPGGVPAAPAAVPVRGRWGPGECQQLRQQCPYVVGGARGSASSSGSSARTWSVGPGGVPAAPAAVPVRGRWGPGECQQLRQQCPYMVGGARGSASSSGSSARTWSVGPGGVPAAPVAVPVRGRWGPGECQQLR